MKKLQDLNFTNRRVILRIECNVPLSGKQIINDIRLRESVATIRYLLTQNTKQIILIGHQGRPNGIDEKMRLDPHAERLSELLGEQIMKLNDCGETIPPEDAKIVMLENLRFFAEKDKDVQKRKRLAEQIAKLGDIYVNDAFGTCHREHASMVELPKLFQEKCAGLLLEKEIENLNPLINNYKKPLTLVIGGSKMETKIDILNNYLDKAENFLIGGGIANTFLQAQGHEIGRSISENDKIQIAKHILKHAKNIFLPIDAITARSIEPNNKIAIKKMEDIRENDNILDIGPQTIAQFKEIIQKSATIIWNGPMGLFELDQFATGTEKIAKSITESRAYSVIGGGDTIEVCQKFGIKPEKFSHLSTGGGAMIAFLEGKKLPGIEALES